MDAGKHDASSLHPFSERVSELEAELNDERRDRYNNRHARLLDDLLTALRETRAALVDARNRVEEGIESEGPMEAGWSKEDRAFVAVVDAILAKYPLEGK